MEFNYDEMELLFMALSVYYSTRHPNNPERIRIQELSSKFMIDEQFKDKYFKQMNCEVCFL